jgi:hypothetical protein
MIVYDMKGKLTGLQITTPKEALFNDYVPEPVVINISKLAPVTPDEAPFDDEMKCGLAFCNDMLKNLAPAAPKEADFNNCSITTGNDNLSVVPDKVTGN